jgi:hypothetical protein
MRKSKFTPEQILQALRQAEAGTPVVEICRRLAVTETTFYPAIKPDDAPVRRRLHELAKDRPAFGVKRLHVLLRRRDGLVINFKKVRRLDQEEGCSSSHESGAAAPRRSGSRGPPSMDRTSAGRWTSCTTCSRRGRACACSP